LAILEDPQIVQLQQDYLLAKSSGLCKKRLYETKRPQQSKAASDKVMQQAQTEAQNQNIMMRGMAEKFEQWALILKI
jgi:cobalt-zinc-cadmium efflux system membrane fusion protein